MKYLFRATMIALLLTFLLSLVLVRPVSKAYIDYNYLKSYYVSSKIDFVIPEPGFDQVNELENDDANGIIEVTPYYSISRISVNEEEILNASGFIFGDANDLEQSPYFSNNRIRGTKKVSAGQAVADKAFCLKYHCKLGDKVSFSIAQKTYTFTIEAISNNNMSTQRGSIAFVLNQDMLNDFVSKGIRYSAAYVYASDYDVCKNYLKNDYRPLGDLKDPSSFESEELYNQYLDSFNSANWFLSMTDFHEVYAMESVKYSEIESRTLVGFIISGIVCSAIIALVSLYPIFSKKNKQILVTMMRKYTTSKKMKLTMVLYTIINYILCQLVTIAFLSPIDAIEANLHSGAFIIVLPLIVSIGICLINVRQICKMHAKLINNDDFKLFDSKTK